MVQKENAKIKMALAKGRVANKTIDRLKEIGYVFPCLLYTSDAADEL